MIDAECTNCIRLSIPLRYIGFRERLSLAEELPPVCSGSKHDRAGCGELRRKMKRDGSSTSHFSALKCLIARLRSNPHLTALTKDIYK